MHTGTGKSFLLNVTRSKLEKMGYVICSSETQEHETYHQPLYAYTLIVSQMFHIVDQIPTFDANQYTLKAPKISEDKVQGSGPALPRKSLTVKDISGKFVGIGGAATTDNPNKKIGFLAAPSNVLKPSKSTSSSIESHTETDNTEQGSDKPGDISNRSNRTVGFEVEVIPNSKSNRSVSRHLGIGTASTHDISDHSHQYTHPKKANILDFFTNPKKRARIAPMTSTGKLESQIDVSSSQDIGVESQPNLTAQMIEFFRNCLVKVGEDADDVLPLLNAVIRPEIPETEDTKALGPDGRINLLISLLVRIANKIAEKKKFAILIDDIQWMDSASWQITMQLIHRCPKVMMVMTMTPVSDYKGKICSQIKDLNQSEVVELRGWDGTEISRYIHNKFCDRVMSIHTDVLEFVKSQTQGMVSYVEDLTQMLVDSPIVTCKNNTLVFNVEQTVIDGRIPNNAIDITLWQYDQLLSKDFQRLLRCAAVIGVKFSLEEVSAIWNDTVIEYATQVASQDSTKKTSLERLEGLIKVYDSFNMIAKRDLENQYADPNHPFSTSYFFRHPYARDAIYDERVSDGEKKVRHKKLIQYYERLITDDTETIFVPLICFHHYGAKVTDRNSVLKRIQYMVMTGNYLCLAAESYMETREIFNDIQEIIFDYNLIEDLGPSVISELYIRLGTANSHGISEEISRARGLQHLLIAIKLLEYHWPETDTDWWTMVALQSLGWLWNNIFARHRSAQKPSKVDVLLSGGYFAYNKKMDRLERLEPLADLLSRHLFATDARLRDQIACDLLCLNIAFKLGRHVSKARTRLMSSLSLKTWFAGYLKLATFIAEKSYLSGGILSTNDEDPNTFATSTAFLTACGRWAEARTWAIRGMEVCQKLGKYLLKMDIANVKKRHINHMNVKQEI